MANLAELPTHELVELVKRAPSRERSVGAPTRYRPEVAELTRRYVRMGATVNMIAAHLGVGRATFLEWARVHPDLDAALNSERLAADEQVASALFNKAVGFKRKAVKAMQHNGQVVLAEYEEHVAPDTAAAFIWLKNRQPELWKDRHEVTGADGKPIEVSLSWVNGRRVVDAEDISPREPVQPASNQFDPLLEDLVTPRDADV